MKQTETYTLGVNKTYEFYSKRVLKDAQKYFVAVLQKYLIITNRIISNIGEKRCEYVIFIMF